MAFVIYPDAATATMLGKPQFTPVQLASGEAMSRFVPLAILAGRDLSADDQQTTFLRIALSGSPVHPSAQLTVELQAGTDGAIATVDPNSATSPDTAVALVDGAGTHIATAQFVPPYADNVYFLKAAIKRPNTQIRIRITNTTGTPRDVVWVVADNPDDTLQPWLHATLGDAVPITIALEALIHQTLAAEPIEITNRGTGRTFIFDTNPPITAPFSLSGLPAPLGPNPAEPIQVRIGFQAPATPSEFPPASIEFRSTNKLDLGPFGPGHNNRFTLGARSFVPPGLAEVPNVIGIDNIIETIRAAGFIARILGRTDIHGSGKCTEQRPAAGTFLAPGLRVRAYISAPILEDGQVLHDDRPGSGSFMLGD